ncbi:MAG: roadblock/LC7 domain-containing protein [Proteobacteria bacterium]|nr:roadblock/LC7 domain-containing protein [Pseudomonadota bacterium]
MPFRSIMKELVGSTRGATGAIFVDWEGEAVDQYTTEDELFHLKVVGAHKCVILELINDAKKALKNEKVESVTIKMENYNVLLGPVKDGYFVAVILKPEAIISEARHRMMKAVAALKKEM